MEKTSLFVIHTRKEMEDIRNAFNKLYRIVDGGTSSIEDYFEEPEDHIQFQRINALINDLPFDRSDHE